MSSVNFPAVCRVYRHASVLLVAGVWQSVEDYASVHVEASVSAVDPE